MKKIFGMTAVITAILIGNVTQQKENKAEILFSNVEALAQSENELCPNGCYDNGLGCYCYRWYSTYREASWKLLKL